MCHGQMISQKLVHARKGHKCSICRRRIPPGTRYRRIMQKDGRDTDFFKCCLLCEAKMDVAHREGGADDYCFDVDEELSEIRQENGPAVVRGWIRESLRKLLSAKS